MNALQVDEQTGFLDADNWNSFNVEKKLKFLELATSCVKEEGKWPDLGKLCDTLDIDPRTLDNHLKQDHNFNKAFRGIVTRGKWGLESLMYNFSSKNPMYCFGWLRKWFPEEYNPDYKHSVTVDINIVHGDQSRLSGIVDAEVVVSTEKPNVNKT